MVFALPAGVSKDSIRAVFEALEQSLTDGAGGGAAINVTDGLGTDVAGNITTNAGAGSTVISNAADGFSTATISIKGTYAGLSGLFEQSDDSGTTWFPVDAERVGTGQVESSIVSLAANSALLWRMPISGSDSVRFRCTAITSGTANVLISLTGMPSASGVGVTANFTDLRPIGGTITAQDVGSVRTATMSGGVQITGTATANSNFSLAINGYSHFNCQVTGTWTGSLEFEKSIDGGTTWTPFGAHIDGTTDTESVITANCNLRGSCGAATNLRLASTAAMTGTANVLFTFASADTVVTVTNQVGILTKGYSNRLTVTRPANATPYTANDDLGGALTFTGMGPAAGGELLLTSVSLEIDVAAVPSGMSSFRLYLYNVTPPSALADNAAWDLPSGDRASFLGYVDLGTPVDLGSTLFIKADIVNAQIKISGSSLFGYLVTNGAFTPAGNSEVYMVTLHAVAL